MIRYDKIPNISEILDFCKKKKKKIRFFLWYPKALIWGWGARKSECVLSEYFFFCIAQQRKLGEPNEIWGVSKKIETRGGGGGGIMLKLGLRAKNIDFRWIGQNRSKTLSKVISFWNSWFSGFKNRKAQILSPEW